MTERRHQREHILIVDDDVSLATLMREYLEQHGFDVSLVYDGADAIGAVAELEPRLIVLDLMLPGTDGLSVCRQIRQTYSGPILMFTALTDEVEEVVGLETGADDYVKKPVSPRLLLARIRTLLRRDEAHGSEGGKSDQEITVNNVSLNRSTRTISLDSTPLVLSTLEFDLLSLLIDRSGSVLSRQEIFREMRQLDYDGLDRSIDMYISRLRKKLGDDSKSPQLIKTVRGSGYLFVKG